MKKHLLPYFLLLALTMLMAGGIYHLTRPLLASRTNPTPNAATEQPSLLYLQAPGQLPLTYRL